METEGDAGAKREGGVGMFARESGIAKPLRVLFNVGTIGGLTDGQLLERFSTDRGEAAELAFAALVERHGPMVRRVCGSVLRDPHEAQDAFQATFLVLVQQARRLWVRDSLGPWLHQVAYRTACCARRKVRRRDRLAKTVPAAEAVSAGARDGDLEAAVQQEIARLPEAERGPLVLCDLQSQTQDEAARHLGVPVGTIKSRLARGRAKLRERLTRRGFGPESLIAAGPTGTGPPLATEAVEAMTRLAVEWTVSGGTISHGAATLARAVLGGMTMVGLLKVGTAVVAFLGMAGGGGWLLQRAGGAGAGDGAVAVAVAPQGPARRGAEVAVEAVQEKVETITVAPGTLQVRVVEMGVTEAARAAGVYSEIEGMTTILRIVPEGTEVKEGDVVAELDSATLRDQLVNQDIAVRRAEAAMEDARVVRETAELALVEYERGTFEQEMKGLVIEKREAESALKRASGRVARTREALAAIDGKVGANAAASDVQARLDVADRLDAAEQDAERHQGALELVEMKVRVLNEYQRKRIAATLQLSINRAKAEEQDKLAAASLEKSTFEKLERQIERCQIRAPREGVVVYAQPRQPGQPMIEEGATVRERQKILDVVDMNGPMRVEVAVQEAWVDRLRPGAEVTIALSAFGGKTFAGRVESIAPLPSAGSGKPGAVRLYPTRISITETSPALRPGMTAQASILIEEHPGVLTVPLRSVQSTNGRSFLQVEREGGATEWRAVVLGVENSTDVEIKKGLKSGERVVVQPDIAMLLHALESGSVPPSEKPAAESR